LKARNSRKNSLKKIKSKILLVFLLFCGCATVSKIIKKPGPAIDEKRFPFVNWNVPFEMHTVVVNGVYDGDTIVVEGLAEEGEGGTVVRLLGIDTPEVAHPEQGFDTVEPGAAEATEFTKTAVNWKRVLLVFDPENKKGLFDRTLALIFYKDTAGVMRCLNWELLRKCLATENIWAGDFLCNKKRWRKMGRMSGLKKSKDYLEMGRACLREKLVYDAFDYYARGVGKYPKAVEIRKNLAALYWNLSKYESDEDKKSSYAEGALVQFRKLLGTKYDSLARQKIKALSK